MNLDARYVAHKLPSYVEDGLSDLMRRLGLEYGAIDLRLTPDGSYVFLEINPAGQFLYIELMAGQKIAATLAAHLAGANRRQTPPRNLRQEVDINGIFGLAHVR